MKEKRFEAVTIQWTVLRELKVIREETLSRASNLLHEGCKRAEIRGDYSER
jgi:hypothetical protein